MTSACLLWYAFPSTLRWRNLKTQQSAAILDLCLRRTRAEKSRDYHEFIVFAKLCFQNISVHVKTQRWCFQSNFSSLRSVLEQLRWPNRRNKAVSNSSRAVRTGLRKPTSSRLTGGSNSTMPAKDLTTTPSQLGIRWKLSRSFYR